MKNKQFVFLGDTHLDIFSGVKQERMYEYQEKFFSDVFFPYLIKNNIKEVIQSGDIFDKRTSISQRSIAFAKRVFFDILQKHEVNLHIITGNHDLFYKDSLKIITADLILREYDNITLYNEPTQIDIHGQNYSIIPWICSENSESIMNFIQNDDSDICFGHLELTGCQLNSITKCEHGTDASIFKKYKKVYSGHIHGKSVLGNVEYIGSPYQLHRNDGNSKSFMVIEHGKKDITVNNPYNLYEQITINDTAALSEASTGDYNDKYVEIYIDYIETPEKLSKFAASLNENYQMYDCQIVPKKEQENNELLVVDTSMIKNNEELISSYAEINNLRSSVHLKLKSLYNSATETK